jgi:hypothetical protein
MAMTRPPARRAALSTLGHSLPTRWPQATLRRAPRKALLRCLLEQVGLARRTPATITTCMVWRGGAGSEREVPCTVGTLRDFTGVAQLPVFSAKSLPAHVPGQGPQSLVGAPPPRAGRGRRGHGPASPAAPGCCQAPSSLPAAGAPGHRPLSANAWAARDAASVYSSAGYEGPTGRSA